MRGGHVSVLKHRLTVSAFTPSTQAPEGFKLLCEGSAAIMYEHDAAKGDKGEPVFYNKVQVLNRDLSIRMVRNRRQWLRFYLPAI